MSVPDFADELVGFRAIIDYVPFDKGCPNVAQLHATPRRLQAVLTLLKVEPGGPAVIAPPAVPSGGRPRTAAIDATPATTTG